MAGITTCALLLMVGAGCASELTSPPASDTGARLATPAPSFSKSATAPDLRELVVITPAAFPTRGHSAILVATACELQEGTPPYDRGTCPVGWIVDRDAHIVWSTTDAAAATVSSTGVVTRLTAAPVDVIAYSSDDGGACTAIGELTTPVYHDVVVSGKKDEHERKHGHTVATHLLCTSVVTVTPPPPPPPIGF